MCMCCNNFTGSDLLGHQWNSFVPHGYVTFNFTDTQICLKYVTTPATYPEATKHCQADGGDLIRLDSNLKYDILTDYLAPVANGLLIDVWIQGTKSEGKWLFHDRSLMPIICPKPKNIQSTGIHLRAARGPGYIYCVDTYPSKLYGYMCEYYRHFLSIYNKCIFPQASKGIPS